VCKVLIADDSDLMRTAIRDRLADESSIHIVGEAASFAETLLLLAASSPDLLVLDLSLPEREQFSPDFVASHLRSVTTVAISLANDDTAQALAKSYGATALLDKIALYTDLIPAIQQSRPGPLHQPLLENPAKFLTASAFPAIPEPSNE
jgi:DNA-binding NarL/FixJ family response regulator